MAGRERDLLRREQMREVSARGWLAFTANYQTSQNFLGPHAASSSHPGSTMWIPNAGRWRWQWKRMIRLLQTTGNANIE